MPSKRNLEDVVNLWLHRLNEAKNHSSGSISRSNNQIQLAELFEKVEKEFHDMKDVIAKVKIWEELVNKEFDAIEKHVTDPIFNNGEETTKMEKALQIMSTKIDQYKKLTSLVQTDSLTSSTANLPQPKQSTSNATRISKAWQRLGIEENIFSSDLIMANFQVSYDILETQLKLCLLCFAIFPEKAIIKKRPLIYWWTGEGLVTQSKENVKKNGDDVFAELIKKGMIQAVHKKGSRGVGSCQVHPWIRLMLIAVAKKDGFFDFDATGRPIANCLESRRSCLMSPDRSPIRHASSSKEEEQNVNAEQNSMDQKASFSSSRRRSNAQGPRGGKLRTLFNVNENYLKLKAEMFSKKNRLEVVQLGRWQDSNDHHIEVDSIDDENKKEVDSIELLKDLGGQKYLRYLSFRGISRITELPASISKPLNLEILDLRACYNLEKLPSGIVALKKLTHLDVSECYLLEHMPKGLEMLSNLHVLKGFVVGNARIKDASRFQDLGKLKNLWKLSIYIASDAVVTDQELGELHRLETLHSLKITWAGEYRSTAVNTQQSEALEREETITPNIVSEENASLEMVEIMDHVIPVAEDNVLKTDEIVPSKKTFKRQATRIIEKLTKSPTLSRTNISMPPNLKKMHLRCMAGESPPYWLCATELPNLEKLYIVGGKLCNLGSKDTSTWKVKILRLKFLTNFNMEWSDIKGAFQSLDRLECLKCDKFISCPCDEDGVWTA
ncbi:hypothetical protein ACHQM5_021608 [Ranunculus cassubicifolius]